MRIYHVRIGFVPIYLSNNVKLLIVGLLLMISTSKSFKKDNSRILISLCVCVSFCFTFV